MRYNETRTSHIKYGCVVEQNKASEEVLLVCCSFQSLLTSFFLPVLEQKAVWEDSTVGKVLAKQGWGHECEYPQKNTSKARDGKWRRENSQKVEGPIACPRSVNRLRLNKVEQHWP